MSAPSAGVPAPDTKPTIAPRHAWSVLVVLLIAQMMAIMDSSIVTVALRTIRDDIDASGAGLQLILSGYTVPFAMLVVTGARLGKDYGYRRLFMLGLAGFTAASLACGLAPTTQILVGGRILQGIFGAMMVPQVLSLIQILFTGKERARAIGYYSMVLALGVGLGQILGGFVVNADLFGAGWRMAFLINVPVGIALYTVGRVLPSTVAEKREQLDFTGVALLGATMVAFLVPLVFGREEGWPWWTLPLLALSFVGFAIFVWFEHRLLRRGGQPVLNFDALSPIGVRPALMACFLMNFSFPGLIFSVTLHLQTALGYSPFQAGLLFASMPVGFAAVSLTWTKLSTPRQRILPIFGALTFSAAVASLAILAQIGWPPALAAILLCIAGAGMAAGYSPLISQVTDRVGPRYASDLSALVTTGMLVFTVASVATIGSLYLFFAEDAIARSATGLSWALGVNAAVLLASTAGAIRMWRSHPERELPAVDDPTTQSTTA